MQAIDSTRFVLDLMTWSCNCGGDTGVSYAKEQNEARAKAATLNSRSSTSLPKNEDATKQNKIFPLAPKLIYAYGAFLSVHPPAGNPAPPPHVEIYGMSQRAENSRVIL